MKKLVRIILGVLFALSAVSKLFSLESFELYLFSFGLASFDLCAIIARMLIIAEGTLGLWLVSGWYYRISRILTSIFIAALSLFLIWRMSLGDTDSCHCMGELVDMNPWQSLLKNILIALLVVFSWTSEGSSFRYDRHILAGLCLSFTVIVFSVNPPDQFYRIGRTSEDLSVENFKPLADSLALSQGKRIVCFYSTGCEHCMNCASKMSGIIRRHDLPVDSLTVLFMQTHQNEDSLITAFYDEHADGLSLDYSVIDPFRFIPITNGSMPLVVLLDNGEIVNEYDYLSLDEKKIGSFFK